MDKIGVFEDEWRTLKGQILKEEEHLKERTIRMISWTESVLKEELQTSGKVARCG